MPKPAPHVLDIRNAAPAPSPFRRWWRKRYKVVTLSALALVIVVGGVAVLAFYLQTPKTLTGEAAVKQAVTRVSKHYLLPSNETPALATVTDTSKLTTPFLKQAKNGDQLLVYQGNKLAIIYRPSIDRVVAVGPVAIDAPPSALQSRN